MVAAAPQQVLVTRQQAAQMLAVCERTIANMQARGQLTAVKVGKSARCIRSEIEAFGRPRV
jgi:excisionase family DNA binding protein